MSLLIVGSTALDDIKTPFGEVKNAVGGSATFASISAGYYAPVSIVGVVGEDFPSDVADTLKLRNVETSGLEIVPGGKTFHWAGYYEYDMNQAHTIDTQLNVFASFIPKLKDNHKQKPYLFLANIDPELQFQVINSMYTRPKFIGLDTMNFWISSKKEELIKTIKLVDLVIINEGEARQLSGEPGLIKAAKVISSWGPKYIIIKKGENGAMLYYDGAYFFLPGYPLEAIKDPTGAGDSFAGGFMGYITKQDNTTFATMKKALLYATVMSSFVVGDFSFGGIADLKMQDIDERVETLKMLIEVAD